MKDEEIREMLEALDILNKYRNFYHSSGDRKEVKISNMIDNFLPTFYKEIIEDELALLVVEKIRMNKIVAEKVKNNYEED